MKKWIIPLTVLLALIGACAYYFLSYTPQIEKAKEDRGYEYIEKILDDVEVEQMVWIEKDLYIKGGDRVFKYSEKGTEAEEFIQVNINSTIGSKDNELIICSWENRLIMSPEEYATKISIINSSGTLLHSTELHETLRITGCNEEEIYLSNSSPILEEITLNIGWAGEKIERDIDTPEISIGEEDNIVLYRNDKVVADLPLINTVEMYLVSPDQNVVSIYTYTNQVWVIYLSK